MPGSWQTPTFLKWLRRTHAWMGLGGAVAGVLFSITTLFMEYARFRIERRGRTQHRNGFASRNRRWLSYDDFSRLRARTGRCARSADHPETYSKVTILWTTRVFNPPVTRSSSFRPGCGGPGTDKPSFTTPSTAPSRRGGARVEIGEPHRRAGRAGPDRRVDVVAPARAPITGHRTFLRHVRFCPVFHDTDAMMSSGQEKRGLASHPLMPSPIATPVGVRWVKKTHAWTGIVTAVLALIFAWSGFMLNHRTLHARLPGRPPSHLPALSPASLPAELADYLDADLPAYGPSLQVAKRHSIRRHGHGMAGSASRQPPRRRCTAAGAELLRDWRHGRRFQRRVGPDSTRSP